MMRPGQQRSISRDDLHISPGHTNDANVIETAKNGDQGGRYPGILRRLWRGEDDHARRSQGDEAQVVEVTTAGLHRSYGASTGGARYCMMMVDANINVGWPLFLRDKSGPTLCHAFCVWPNAVKLVVATYGGLGIARFDNGHEFINAEFRKLLTELGIAVEYTPVDGEKGNGGVERKLVLIAESAKVAWLEFPRYFPDLGFPNKALEWTTIEPKALKWMKDCINMTSQAHFAGQAVPVGEAVKEARNQSHPAVHDPGLPPPQPEKQDGV